MRWLVLAVGGIALVWFVGTLYGRLSSPERDPVPPADGTRFDRLHIKGLDYTSTFKGKKIFALRADELIHRKRRVGPLTINPLKEIAMTGVRLDIYAGSEEPDAVREGPPGLSIPLQRIVKESGASQGLGFVSRVLMDDLTIRFLAAAEETIFSVEAKHAELGAAGREVVLSGGILARDASGATLRCDSLVWHQNSGGLRTRGKYSLSRADGTVREGRDGSFLLGIDGRLSEPRASSGRGGEVGGP